MNEELVRLWPRAEHVLDRVLDLPEPDRLPRAIAACDGDAALERAVRLLLTADADTSGFLEPRSGPLLDDDETSPALPDDDPAIARVGPFRIVRELGRGGMGTVLLGERDDGAFEQRVAVKVLHRGMAGPEVREVLVRERRILARLEHPGIARMYDGGVTPDGEPYFIMEYVDGLTIDAYCDEHRLGIPERLALFVDVCRAVEYAHGRFVVHCDLKPRNILVRSDGQVKLVDFGIARLLEDGAAGDGGTALTPAYAAPEQERGGPISAATDVFQLGLVLYELLSGRRARASSEVSVSAIDPPSLAVRSEGADATAARRSSHPRALVRRLEGDLDAIVLKALRPDAAERYATVGALRRDLESLASHRPIAAREPEPGYRLAKFVVRNRWGVLAASAVTASLTAGIVGIAAQSRIAAAERDRARLAERRASAVNEFVLHELLRAPMPESSLGRELTVAEVLANAARSVEHAFEGQPATEAEVRLALARTYSALGRPSEAGLHARQAYELLSGMPSMPALALEEAERTVAEVSFDAGRYREAASALDELYGRQRSSPGIAHSETLRTAAALGEALNGLGEYERSEVVLRDALAVAESAHPDSWRLAVQLSTPLGQALLQQGEGVEAERLARGVLARVERHLGPQHPDRVAQLIVLGNALAVQLRYAEALQVADEAVTVCHEIYGARHPANAEALYARALARDRLGRYDDALADLDAAHDIAVESLGPDHPRTVFLRFSGGILARNSGDPRTAERVFREVVETRARLFGDGNVETIRALRSLYLLLVAEGREGDARDVARRMLAAYDTAASDPNADALVLAQHARFLLEVEPRDLRDPHRALSLAERAVQDTARRRFLPLRALGDALVANDRADQGIAVWREALQLPDGIRSWSTEEDVVARLETEGRIEEIETFLEERIATQRARPEANERMIAKSSRLLARWYESRDRPADAERAYREAVEILRRAVPEDNWELGRALSELGGCVAAQGRFDEAEALLLDGFRILELDRQARRALTEARERLVALYERWGRLDEAERWRRP